jgi:hypothetical protein
MLTSDPIAIMTPWNRGRKLPTAGDRQRISGLSKQALITSSAAGTSNATANYAVAKTIRESGIKISSAEGPVGRVTARTSINSKNPVVWNLEMSPEAAVL